MESLSSVGVEETSEVESEVHSGLSGGHARSSLLDAECQHQFIFL